MLGCVTTPPDESHRQVISASTVSINHLRRSLTARYKLGHLISSDNNGGAFSSRSITCAHRVFHSHTSHECRATRKFSEDGERIASRPIEHVTPSMCHVTSIRRRCGEITARRIFSKSFSDDLRFAFNFTSGRALSLTCPDTFAFNSRRKHLRIENTLRTNRVVTLSIISIYVACNVVGECRGRPLDMDS